MKPLKSFLVTTAIVALPLTSFVTQGRDDDHDDHARAPAKAQVDFGVLPTAPLGPPPCLQTGAIGGPADPCSYLLHRLTPEETTVAKGGEVSFQVHGGGHGIALYRVSKDTTREGIGQFLCPGPDPSRVALSDIAQLKCNLSATNAAAKHEVLDGDGDVVYVAAPNITNAHPDNRVWSEPGRLMSAGGRQFLNGGTIPAKPPGVTPASDGQLVTYRFLKPGRYLVICMNRTHHLNDWMFGFVNVTGGDD
jgi:plastocyanin